MLSYTCRADIEEHDEYIQLLQSNSHDLLAVRMTIHLYFSAAKRLSTASNTQV